MHNVFEIPHDIQAQYRSLRIHEGVSNEMLQSIRTYFLETERKLFDHTASVLMDQCVEYADSLDWELRDGIMTSLFGNTDAQRQCDPNYWLRMSMFENMLC